MEEKKEEKMYTRSNGEVIKISSMHTEHIINGLSKMYKEVFEAKDMDDYIKRMNNLNDLKEELYLRFNTFGEALNKDKEEE